MNPTDTDRLMRLHCNHADEYKVQCANNDGYTCATPHHLLNLKSPCHQSPVISSHFSIALNRKYLPFFLVRLIWRKMTTNFESLVFCLGDTYIYRIIYHRVIVLFAHFLTTVLLFRPKKKHLIINSSTQRQFSNLEENFQYKAKIIFGQKKKAKISNSNFFFHKSIK